MKRLQKKRKGMLIINKLLLKKQVSIEELARDIYGNNSRNSQLRVIKNIGNMRIRKNIQIKYDKKTRQYSILEAH